MLSFGHKFFAFTDNFREIVIQATRLSKDVDGAIVLSREDQTLECVVTWLDDGQLEIASSDGSAQVTYDRSPEPEPGDIGSSNPLVNGKL